MAVMDALHDAREELPRFLLVEAPFRPHVVEELAVGKVLHCDNESSSALKTCMDGSREKEV